MTSARALSVLLICLALVGCGHDRQALSTTTSPLGLTNVVLYRNGVGYFERHGVIDGDKLTLKVRKDQINDLLKSLTVIDRGSGKALSVSIPLDPKVWQDAALAMLTPGNGRLSDILDALRGTEVKVETNRRTVQGRIVMVERMAPEPPRPYEEGKLRHEPEPMEDHKLTLLDGDTLEVVRLSQVENITLRDGDLAMQLDRHLDATAGEGMFQQVDVVVRLSKAGEHDLAVSYVAPAPLWKPTYRVVLSDDASGKALLQAWAVVSNVSGENWNDVSLGLTSGAPLAFRYDLHTPEDVERPDLTASGVQKHAQVSMGETTYAESAAAPAPPPMAPQSAAAPEADYSARAADMDDMAESEMYREESAEKKSKAAPSRARRGGMASGSAGGGMMGPGAPAPMPSMNMDALAQSVSVNTSSKRVAGLTRFDLGDRVTLPDGSASMVALINQSVSGEEAFLYKPGGGGQGYEQNPYRVVRFRNDTEFALEPGPISIYSGGSFVGEGLSETIASRDMATIPFAVEPSILVRSNSEYTGNEQMRLVRLVRGVLEVESFAQVTTTWSVESRPSDKPIRVLVRQSRAGDAFTLVDPPKETETLPDGYFIPMLVPAKQTKLELKVVERSPSRIQLTIWDDQAPELLKQLLELPNLDAASRAALQPIVDARQAIGRIDTELGGLSAQQAQLDERAEQERENLRAIQKDPRGAALRKRLSERLEELSKQAAEIGRKIVELNSQRLEKKIELEDTLRDLDLDGSKAASTGMAK